ncbi:unnamed protein product [Adineta ricciae]|uniref:BED-type domain-containing protein n=1 Tax=Adineta ricciae TaxID=249248 RepID=A0A815VR69_ADIRI|nr:unnamed protein product [Adineta ricciae]
MKKRPSKKVAKAVINVTTNDSSSENSLFDQSLSAPTVLPSTPSNDTDATEENVREQLQTIVDQPLTLDLDEDQESISKITVNGSKRKKAPTKQFHQSKAAKTSVDSLATASSININEAEESNDENHSLQSSAVWKYATRIKIEGKQYAICFDCRAQISTNNWSTSALRRHLIVMHNRLDFHAYFDPLSHSLLSESDKRAVEQRVKQTITNGDVNANSQSSTAASTSLSAQASARSPIIVDVVNSTTTSTDGSGQKKNVTAMEAFLMTIGDTAISTPASTKRASIVEEIYNYRLLVEKFNHDRRPSISACVEFWKIYQDALPSIFKLAQQLICTPATSVASEAAFSIAAFAAQKERSRLSAENLSTVIFLKKICSIQVKRSPSFVIDIIASVPKVEGVSLSHLSDITMKTKSNNLSRISSNVNVTLGNELSFDYSTLPKTNTDWSTIVQNIIQNK